MSAPQDPWADAPDPAPVDAKPITRPVVPQDPTPSSPEAETHVLGCCLMPDSDGAQRAVDSGVGEEFFYNTANRLTWIAVEYLTAAKSPTSPESVAERLRSTGDLEKVGGFPYLFGLTEKLPTSAHLSHFITRLQDANKLRRIHRLKSVITTRIESKVPSQELIQELKETLSQCDDTTANLKDRSYDSTRIIPKPAAIYRTADTTICTPGNITAIYSEAKAGKSSVMGAMLAATMVPEGQDADTLGIFGPNPQQKAVIHFDTEQSPYDWQQVIHTALRRAKLAKPPKWFHSFTLTGLPAHECRRLIFATMRRLHRAHNGIHSVHIDGVADIVVNPNDENECFPVITELHAAAIEYDTAILNVLHMNPGSENQKGRGHLGSQLERKAESNLTLEKDGDTTLLYATKQRGKRITRDHAIAFAWSEEEEMHVSAKQPAKQKAPNQKHFLDAYLSVFPTEAAQAKPFPVILRSANAKRPINRNSFWTLVEQGSMTGEIQVDRTNVNEPRYWVKD